MKKGRVLFSVCAFIVMVSALGAHAEGFNPLFKVRRVKGSCKVKAPGGIFAPATVGKAYEYGTRIVTGRKSACIIEFSETKNICTVMANANLEITQDVSNAKLKIIKLEAGKVAFDLEKDFQKNTGPEEGEQGEGYQLHVETATAICAAIACRFDVEVVHMHGLVVSIFKCHEGHIEVRGSEFRIPEIMADDWVTVSSTPDLTYTRLENARGAFGIFTLDASGGEKVNDSKVGSVLKIWRKVAMSGKNLIVTLLFVDADGKSGDAVVCNREIPEGEMPPVGKPPSRPPVAPDADGARRPPAADPQEKDDQDDQDDDEMALIPLPMRPANMPTLTTIPPTDRVKQEVPTFTPVGQR